jgi:hypothetical protein
MVYAGLIKDNMKALIQAGMNTEQRRGASRAIWENTKEPAKKELGTELLKDEGAGHHGLGTGEVEASN